jgi:hypothetical protein
MHVFKCEFQEECPGFKQGDQSQGLPCKDMFITPETQEMEFYPISPICRGEKRGKKVKRLFFKVEAA